MKTLPLALCFVLAACGGAETNDGGNEARATTSTDAVTAEAVRDTQAAEADAMKAADAELDNLGNAIDDGAGNRAADRVSNTAKVEVN